MRRAYQRARLDPSEIALGMLETLGVSEPTERQYVFASAVGEFLALHNVKLGGK